MSRPERGVDRGTVLITGAGRGIGRAVAGALAHRGYSLILTSRTQATLDETHQLCASLVATRSMVVDVRDERAVARLDELVAGTPLFAVVNNAGIGEWSQVEEVTSDSWDRQLDTNLKGVFLVVRETLRHFRDQGRGLYVNVASDCSLVGMGQRAAYNASKFGLVGLTSSLRAELAGDNVHFALVYVGKADTHFREHRPGDRPGALSADDVARAIAFVIESYPSTLIGEMTVLPPGVGLTGTRSLS